MVIVNANGHNIWYTGMIEKSTGISVEIGIDAVVGGAQVEEVAVVGTSISLATGQYFADVFGNESAHRDILQRLNAQSFDFVVAFEHLHRHFGAILDDAIFAEHFIATAHVIALEYHGRIAKIEIGIEATLGGVPVSDGDVAALAILCRATGKSNLMKD